MLQSAFEHYPTVLALLADKLDVRVPEAVQAVPAFKVILDSSYVLKYSQLPSKNSLLISVFRTEEDSIVHLLSHLYAYRSGNSIWKTPEIGAWFQDALTSFSASLPLLSPSPTLELFRSPPTSLFSSSSDKPESRIKEKTRWSVYRHILTNPSLPTSLRGFVPPYIVAKVGVAADPLPPSPSQTAGKGTWYNDAFFIDAATTDESPDGTGAPGRPRRQTRRERENEERNLARLIPDRAQRNEIATLHSRLVTNLAGMGMGVGLLQFAQMVQENPEIIAEVVAAIDGFGPLAHGGGAGGMPGGFGGQDDEDMNVPDADAGARLAMEVRMPDLDAPVPDHIGGLDDDSESDDEGTPEGEEEDEYIPVCISRALYFAPADELSSF